MSAAVAYRLHAKDHNVMIFAGAVPATRRRERRAVSAAQWFSAGAVAAAALAAGFTGFGFNITAVPLLLITLGAREAVIVALLLGLLATITLSAGALHKREVRTRALSLLLVGGLPGLALGTISYSAIGATTLGVVIAVISIAGAVVLTVGRRAGHRPLRAREAFAVGTIGGFFTATTGTGGPPIVTYLAMTDEPRATSGVRGTVLAYSSIVTILAVTAHALRGQVSGEALIEAARLAPVTLAGLLAGTLLFRRVSPATYRWVTNATLLAIGVSGLIILVR
jgi:uncharacterized membrane protein YfcA